MMYVNKVIMPHTNLYSTVWQLYLNKSGEKKEFSHLTNKKNTIENINIIMDEAEERIYDLEDRNFEIIQPEENKGIRMKKSKQSLYELWYTKNLRIVGRPEE